MRIRSFTRAALVAAATLAIAPAEAQGQASAANLEVLPVARPILRAPPVYKAQPDPLNPGRFLSFTDKGCAVIFRFQTNRGMTWSGNCVDGRIDGPGTLMGYDYDQQPNFIFEGEAQRGRRMRGTITEVAVKDRKIWAERRPFVDGEQQEQVTVLALIAAPRAFLLALDDYTRQTSGTGLISELEAQELAKQEAAQRERESRELAQALGQLAGVLAQGSQRPAPQATAPAPAHSAPQPRPVPAITAQAQTGPSSGQNRYYAPLTCVQMGTQRLSNGQVIPCIQNNCGRSIEAHASVGMWTVPAGICYSGPSRNIVLHAACERNDSYDSSRRQCRR